MGSIRPSDLQLQKLAFVVRFSQGSYEIEAGFMLEMQKA